MSRIKGGFTKRADVAGEVSRTKSEKVAPSPTYTVDKFRETRDKIVGVVDKARRLLPGS